MSTYNHNVTLLVADPEQGMKYVHSVCGTHTITDPDFIKFETDNFLIDDARKLESLLMSSGIQSGLVVVVSVQNIRQEAQNALLKILEELPPDTKIFIIIPNAGLLLPTLLSRMSVINMQKQINIDYATEFLNKSVIERLEFLQNLHKQDDFIKQINELTDSMLEFCKNDIACVSKISTLKKYLSMSVGPIKPALEELAFLCYNAKN